MADVSRKSFTNITYISIEEKSTFINDVGQFSTMLELAYIPPPTIYVSEILLRRAFEMHLVTLNIQHCNAKVRVDQERLLRK